MAKTSITANTGGFKLLAIRPIKVKNSKLLKVLRENEIYRFYQDYVFLNKGGEEVRSTERVQAVKYTPTVPSSLYSDDNVSINVSAVVGMNGSGKSSLIELFFAALYNLSVKLKILEWVENDDYEIEKLEPLEDFEIEIFYLLNDSVFCLRVVSNAQPTVRIIEYGSSSSNRRHFRLTQLVRNKKEHLKEFFFYTIAVNYSIHGLNSKQMGIWVKSLFHKNDGYQTPLVVNPYRRQGNFDINIELYLAKQRLLSNLLRPVAKGQSGHFQITDAQRVEVLTFSLNKSKIEYAFKIGKDGVDFESFFEIENRTVLLNKINTAFFGKNLLNTRTKYKREVENYVVKKIIQIARTYPEYKKHFRDDVLVHVGVQGSTKNKAVRYRSYFIYLDRYLKRLANDRSHLTFKLRQALHYLKFNTLRDETRKKILWKSSQDLNGNHMEVLNISIQELSGRINKVASRKLGLIEFIPPSLFDIEIRLRGENNSESFFSELSSGEQQLIHSVQSIVYHAVNVNSVFSGLRNEKDKVTYKYLNIILDEVELYFHPEFQRNFIKELIGAIRRMKLRRIRHFNILFSTHSTFILSDIPSGNILRLKRGQPSFEREPSFGANIHDLLAKDFFLTKGFMGQFAKEKINDIIQYLTHELNSKEIADILAVKKKRKLEDFEIAKLNYLKICNKGIKGENTGFKYDHTSVEEIIKIVGEPILRDKLLQMHQMI